MKFIVIITILLLFISCENVSEIDFKLKETINTPIVTGMISLKPNQSWVQLQYPCPALNPFCVAENPDFNNAKVHLMHENEEVASFSPSDSGFFYLQESYTPKTNTEYYLKVTIDNEKLIVSEKQRIPLAAPIDSIKYELFEWDYMAYKYKIDFFFLDTPSEQNFYRYEHFAYYQNNESDGNANKLPSIAYIFTDEGKDGDNFQIRFHVNSTKNRNKLDSIKIVLYTFSPDLNKLSESMLNYDGSIQDTFTDFPSPLFSNMNNAYGCFGGYNKYTYTVLF